MGPSLKSRLPLELVLNQQSFVQAAVQRFLIPHRDWHSSASQNEKIPTIATALVLLSHELSPSLFSAFHAAPKVSVEGSWLHDSRSLATLTLPNSTGWRNDIVISVIGQGWLQHQ